MPPRSRRGDIAFTIPTKETEKEVYESKDVKELDDLDDDEGAEAMVRQSHNLDIDVAPTDPIASFEKFAGKTFDLTNADLSDAVVPSHFTSKQRTYTVMPRDKRKFESPLEAFQRLKAEVAQLTNDLDMISEESAQENELGLAFDPQLLTDLKKLETDLTSIASSERFGGILQRSSAGTATKMVDHFGIGAEMETAAAKPNRGAGSTVPHGGVTYELYSDQTTNTAEERQLSRLNQRVSVLEGVIGTDVLNKDIKSICKDLLRQTQMMDVTHMELIGVRLEALTKKMDTLPTKTASQDRKVDSLFDILSKVEPIIQEVPLVVRRLQSLQCVHELGATMVSDMQQLQLQQADIQSALQTQSGTLVQLEEGMKQNFANIVDNFKSIEHRMANLERKLG